MIMKSELKNVRDVMNKSIISVDKDDIIRTAVNKMVHGEIGAVIVTEKDKPVGILTERYFKIDSSSSLMRQRMLCLLTIFAD